MANNVPELTKVGIGKETAWGNDATLTAPNVAAANSLTLLPVEPPDIKEEIDHIVDENIRGVRGRDFEAYAGMRKVTGNLKGLFYAGDDGGTNAASPVALILEAFFGGDQAVQIGTSAFYQHEFYEAEPDSLTIAVHDDLNAGAGNDVPIYLGVMVPKFTLEFNASEGLLAWNADLLGIRQVFSSAIIATAFAADKTKQALLSWGASVHFGTAAANPAAITGKLLSATINLEREITLKIGAANQNYPNIRAARSIRATFTAVVELQDYADYQLYSNDIMGGARTNFMNNQQAWTFRFTPQTSAAITTATAEAGLTGATLLNDDDDGMLDVRLHAVSYGEAPLTISRGEVANTMEFSGKALYTPIPTYFGVSPNATAEPGSRVVQMRLLNKKTAAY